MTEHEWEVGDDDAARRRMAPAATNEPPKEGQKQVEDGKEDYLLDADALLERLWQKYRDVGAWNADNHREKMRMQASPSYKKLMQERIRLKGNGVEMYFGNAHLHMLHLAALQEQEPDQFAELVRRVRPSGATRLPGGTPDPKVLRALDALVEDGLLTDDGGRLKPDPWIAAVLDAAYTETKEGVVLRNPVVPPRPTFADEVLAAAKEADRAAAPAFLRAIKEAERMQGRDDTGPAR
jgi:hypothetical protein